LKPAATKIKILREVLLNFSELPNKSIENKSQNNIQQKVKWGANVFERSYNYASPAS